MKKRAATPMSKISREFNKKASPASLSDCASHSSTVSYDIQEHSHSAEQFLRLTFLQNPATEYTSQTLSDILLEKHRRRPSNGSLRNMLSKLKTVGLITSFRSGCAFYRLAQVKCDMDSMAIVSRKSCVVRFDFWSFVGGLDWGSVGVHDVRVYTSVASLDFCSGLGLVWVHYPRRCLYQACVELGGLRLVLQARYGKGKSLMVIAGCSGVPIVKDLDGLMRLVGVLSDLRGRYLSGSVPSVEKWVVKSWHYGRDARSNRGVVEGPAFEVTFENWFRELCRVYSKPEGVRVEEVQSPNESLSLLIEKEKEKAELSGQVASMATGFASMASEIRNLRGEKLPFADTEPIMSAP